MYENLIGDVGGSTNNGRSKDCLGKWLIMRRKRELHSHFMPKDPRWNKHLSIENKTINLIEENIIEYL